MGRAGLYCLETQLATRTVQGGALGLAEGLQGQITHRPGRVLNWDACFQRGAGLPTCLVPGQLLSSN